MEIVQWDAAYRQAWRRLSLSWLEQYGLVEEEDLRILNDPEGIILSPGGMIFLALEAGELLGTLSLIHAGHKTYELAKMGVAPAHRRRGVADGLMREAHGWAHRQGANKLTLFTNRKLEAAQQLYDKWCFSQICAPDQKFLLSDKQMEKLLYPAARAVMETPLGNMELQENRGMLVGIRLCARPRALVPPETPLLEKACRQMEEYFSGRRQRFTLPCSIEGGSAFQSHVLETLLRRVPFGSTVSYGRLAELAGHPGAARAVGNALGRNPLCILIPCHRVLPARGGVGGYCGAAGGESKAWLLKLEGQLAPAIKTAAQPSFCEKLMKKI